MAAPDYSYRHEKFEGTGRAERTPIGLAFDFMVTDPEGAEGLIIPPGGAYAPEGWIRERAIQEHTGSQALTCLIFLPDDRLVHHYAVRTTNPAREFYTFSVLRAFIGEVGFGGQGSLRLTATNDGCIVNNTNDVVACVDRRTLVKAQRIASFTDELLDMALLS